MNFYKHHIGDYAQATAHLSFVEDAAYSRLIRKYYADERALPEDVKAVQRLVGARTREEKDAVQSVLDEFFFLQAGSWHNKRCDIELARANAQAETNRRIAEEREARRRERMANGSSHESFNGVVHESLKRSEHESLPVREPSQTPDSRHQTPDTRQGSEDTRSDLASMRVSMVGAVCIALKAEGIGSCNPGHPDLQVLLEQGAEVQNFVSAARTARDKGKGFAYVLGIVKGQLAEARQLAASGRATTPPATHAPTRAERNAATIAGLTGTSTERTDHAASSERAIDVESRIVE